jgi:hypothetical protein
MSIALAHFDKDLHLLVKSSVTLAYPTMEKEGIIAGATPRPLMDLIEFLRENSDDLKHATNLVIKSMQCNISKVPHPSKNKGFIISIKVHCKS